MSEPKHLLEEGSDASSVMRAALRGARADVPDAARVEALSRAIAGAVGGGGGGGDGDGGGGGGAGTGTGTGTWGVKLVLGGVAVAAIGAVMATRGSPVPASPTAAPAPTAIRTATATAIPAASASAEPTLDVHALPAAATAPIVVDAARAGSSATPSGSPEAEMALLRTAQDALARSPAEALTRCEEHAKSYPSGMLADEREILAVDALVRLGRRPEAEARAARFRASHPGSAYLRRLDTLLAPAR